VLNQEETTYQRNVFKMQHQLGYTPMFSNLPHQGKFLDQDSVTAREEKHLEKCTCPASELLLLQETTAYISFRNNKFVNLNNNKSSII